MVSRVGKFVGGFNQDVTNTVNAHATENRVAFGHGDTNPTANVHVVGNILATTTVTATGGFIVPDDGDVGSASATDAMQISSAGIVTFKDDIKIKDGGTIGSATTPAAITVASDGIVTFADDIKIKNDGTIGSAGAATAMTIDSSGIVTFVDDIKIKDDGTIGSASAAGAMTIDSSGIVSFVDDIKIKDDGTIGSASAATAMTIDASGIVSFVDDIKIKDGGTIGVASAADAMTVSSAGIVTFKDDILIKDGGTIGSATTADAITVADVGAITLADDLAVTGNAIVTLGVGATGNTAPAIDTASFGNPANVVIRAVSQKGGNVIIGDATATSDKSLDVRGTANVGALTATTGTYSGRLVVDDTTEATSTTDGSLQTDGGLSVAGDAVFGDDIKLITDASVASFGVNGEITLTHVHNTGLLLEDSGGSPTLQFHDSNESVSSDGSKLILTSNGVAFNMPTADGNDGQVLQTDGSRTLSFADAAAGDLNPATELASDLDCGTVGSGTQDAFGQATSALDVLDLLTAPERSLGTVDQGALS